MNSRKRSTRDEPFDAMLSDVHRADDQTIGPTPRCSVAFDSVIDEGAIGDNTDGAFGLPSHNGGSYGV